ncbi:unnamed protein product [Blepharisma stoltei]|uniref:C2H2-type domain-containing protein n=1 Tax=Blepharisma stoltei TaxID=1481888 RepID=A0AAU9ITT0_9CILI|nr:unnamed protein product [Blepharisma stoltei]
MKSIQEDVIAQCSSYFLLYHSHLPLLKERRDSLTNFCSIFEIRNNFIADFELDQDTINFLDLDLGLNSDDLSWNPNSPSTSASFDNDDLQCHLCNKTFKCNKGLRQHLGKRHSQSNEGVACHICGKSFKHKYAVKFHINQVHDKTTRVSCPLCGKSIYNKYMLSQHMERMH